MKARWNTVLTGAAVAAALAVACGPGRAIFVVDVFSFMNAGTDTVHYTVPIVTTDSVRNTPLKVNLLGGAGNSEVDTVTITAAADLLNNSGAGNVSFQVFFAADSAATYSGSPLLTASGTAGPGTTTTQMGGTATVVGDSIFKNQTLWVGVQAKVTSTTAPLDGKIQLTALTARIVLKDKIF